MNIENFELKHLDGVEEIEKICFAHPWSRADLQNQISLDTSHFLVATVGGEVAGYMGLQIFGGEGYVTNVAVLPEYRKQGIAESLVRAQMKNKMSFITLEVRESNVPAVSLYTKCGFKNVGVRPNFYTDPTENAIIMTYEFEDE